MEQRQGHARPPSSGAGSCPRFFLDLLASPSGTSLPPVLGAAPNFLCALVPSVYLLHARGTSPLPNL